MAHYLRRSVEKRIRDEVRRQQRRAELLNVEPPDDDGDDASADDRLFDELSDRDRALIESRIEHALSYEDIAALFQFPTPAAARAAVRRAMIRLAQLIERRQGR